MSVDTLHFDIRAAFRAALLAISGLPAKVAWEGENFTPTVGEQWMREGVQGNGDLPVSLGMQQHDILLTVNLFVPTAQGAGKVAELLAGKVLVNFKPGTRLTYGSNGGVVMRAVRKGGLITEQEWISTVVVLTVSAYTID